LVNIRVYITAKEKMQESLLSPALAALIILFKSLSESPISPAASINETSAAPPTIPVDKEATNPLLLPKRKN